MAETSFEMDFDGVKRSALVSSSGLSYAEFRRTLTPRYWLVWLHLVLGYGALAALAAATAVAERTLPLPAVIAVGLLSAAAIGYVLHYLHLFMHEAAHYNFHPDRKWNDRLANVLVGSLVGMHTQPYRPTHFDHHRYLGTPQDTEISYFDPLNVRFFLVSLLGLRVFKVLVDRNKTHRVKGIGANRHKSLVAYRALVVSILVHGAVALACVAAGFYVVAAAWLAGAFAFYPTWGSLRTLLEHRSEHADKTVDYTQTPHGAVNRMFGTGVIASSFGHAGFNRHLLHHWDPQLSYTRLRDLELFLLETEPGRQIIEYHRTTYSKTFTKLYNK